MKYLVKVTQVSTATIEVEAESGPVAEMIAEIRPYTQGIEWELTKVHAEARLKTE